MAILSALMAIMSALMSSVRDERAITQSRWRLTRCGISIPSSGQAKVVFSRWLKGFGLLVIINHGQGYMTLYGRNNSLYQKAGDWVNAGDVIATVGQSGGFSEPSLYFAIRHNSQPQNPEKWCRKRT